MFLFTLLCEHGYFFPWKDWQPSSPGTIKEGRGRGQGQRTLSSRLSSMDFEYSLSLYSSRSMCALSMSADR